MSDLRKSIDKRTEIVGKAFDAKAGAVIIIGDNIPIYISRVTDWPSDVLGRTVKVKGILRYRKHIPVATVDETGAISQGIAPEGDPRDYVMEKAEWEIVG